MDDDSDVIFNIRLRKSEKQLIERAGEKESQPGARGGASTWARQVLLREARQVLEASSEPTE